VRTPTLLIAVLPHFPPCGMITAVERRSPASVSLTCVNQEMEMVDENRVEGSAKNIGGKIKEGFGKLTGDSKTETEGKADQVEGKVQNTVGGIKDTVKDAFSDRKKA
jgi:uncharacterized protein YjbJ (UPF0337 family)